MKTFNHSEIGVVPVCIAALLGAAMTAVTAVTDARTAAAVHELTGAVRTVDGRRVAAMVTARNSAKAVAVSVRTTDDGRYRLVLPIAGTYIVTARADGYADAARDSVKIPGAAEVALELRPGAGAFNSSAWLALLPDGEEKQRFILDCTGCHLFDDKIAQPGGTPRTEPQWVEAVQRMLGFAGATSGFPVISTYRHAERTAAWIAPHVRAQPSAANSALGATPAQLLGRATIVEYDVAGPGELPHDVAVDSSGRVIVTGMFSNNMYLLNVDNASVEGISIPLAQANPRAVEIDAAGNWWVALGNPKKVARYAPSTRAWSFWDIGVYPHSLAPDNDGGAWFNGHFTRAPELIGRAGRAGVSTHEVPAHPTLAGDAGGPIPYELRTAADGSVWGSELTGNRLFHYTPATGRFDVFTLPIAHSGPRRIDIDAQGNVWVPAYAANTLLRLDPRTGAFDQYPLPLRDALPYVVRVDAATRYVWVGTAAADALLRFDPATTRFTVYPLPSRGALVRHMAVDARRHGVWLAYGASPGSLPARIAFVQPE